MNQQNNIQPGRQPWYKTGLGKSGIGMGIADGALDFAIRRYTNPEEHIMVSAAKSAGTAAAWMIAPSVMWGVTGVQLARAAGNMVGQYQKESYEKQITGGLARPNFGGEFQDTEMGYTMRQRGVAAMQSSRMNARSALMNEARSLHRM